MGWINCKFTHFMILQYVLIINRGKKLQCNRDEVLKKTN